MFYKLLFHYIITGSIIIHLNLRIKHHEKKERKKERELSLEKRKPFSGFDY